MMTRRRCRKNTRQSAENNRRPHCASVRPVRVAPAPNFQILDPFFLVVRQKHNLYQQLKPLLVLAQTMTHVMTQAIGIQPK